MEVEWRGDSPLYGMVQPCEKTAPHGSRVSSLYAIQVASVYRAVEKFLIEVI